MAIWGITPTQEVIKEANAQGITTEEYINSKPRFLNRSGSNDARRMGQYEFYDDLFIQRDDGTVFILHELQSDVEGFSKFEISEVRDNTIQSPKILYSEKDEERGIIGISAVRLQNDPMYLNALANGLLAANRIEHYERTTNLHQPNKGFVYIGTLANVDGLYQKRKRIPEKDAINSIVNTIENKVNSEKRNRQMYEMRQAIMDRLPKASMDELWKICSALGINHVFSAPPTLDEYGGR